jgi:hypothetical protein
MELLLVDLCKDTVLKRPTPARTTTAGAVFDVPISGKLSGYVWLVYEVAAGPVLKPRVS